MHYPGHIREAFEEWVEAGMPPIAALEVQYEPRQVPASRLLGMLWHCTDIMPGNLRQQLEDDLPGLKGCRTYAAAAQALTAGVV